MSVDAEIAESMVVEQPKQATNAPAPPIDEMEELMRELGALRVDAYDIKIATALADVRKFNFSEDMIHERDELFQLHSNLYEIVAQKTIPCISLRLMLVQMASYGWVIDWPRLLALVDYDDYVMQALGRVTKTFLNDEQMLSIFKGRPKLFNAFVECWKNEMFQGQVKRYHSYALLPYEIFGSIVDDKELNFSHVDVDQIMADPEIDERNKILVREKHCEEWMTKPWAGPYVQELIIACVQRSLEEFGSLDRAMAKRMVAAVLKINPNLDLTTNPSDVPGLQTAT